MPGAADLAAPGEVGRQGGIVRGLRPLIHFREYGLAHRLFRGTDQVQEFLRISRDMAADMIGVTPRTLASYERGEREITTDRVEKMALAYKTTFTDLTNYKNVLTEINA